MLGTSKPRNLLNDHFQIVISKVNFLPMKLSFLNINFFHVFALLLHPSFSLLTVHTILFFSQEFPNICLSFLDMLLEYYFVNLDICFLIGTSSICFLPDDEILPMSSLPDMFVIFFQFISLPNKMWCCFWLELDLKGQ